MSKFSWAGWLGLTSTAILVFGLSPLHAQRRTLYRQSPASRPQQLPFPTNRNQYVAPNTTARQLNYNTRGLGQADRNLNPWLHSGYPGAGGARVAPVAVAPVPVYGGGYGGGYGGYGGGYGGYGNFSQGAYGSYLQGVSSYTQAAGEYQIQTQQARLIREQSRQSAIDTKRKELEWELEYEKYRPTAPKMMAQEQATDLDWARNHAQNTEIWSGRTLNVLLKNILKSPSPTSGPSITLDPNMVAGLNLTDMTTRGSLALAKDDGAIEWPEALQEEAFDETRDRFAKTFDVAIKNVHSGAQPSIQTLRGLRNDLKAMESKLDDMVRDLSPSNYIGARRLLNKLNDTIKGLSNPRLCKSCNSGWKQNVRNVSELVGYCMKNGLQFGPTAAPGDEASYTATYYAIRNYDRGITLAAR